MRKVLLFAISAIIIAGCVKTHMPEDYTKAIPKAKKVEIKTMLHGYEITDNYAYMRTLDDYVLKYIESENAYTDNKLKKIKPLEEKIYTEILSRIKENDLSVPYRIGDYNYYSKSIEGEQYSEYCRKHIESDIEEVILNVNEMAQAYDYYDIANIRIADDENMLLFMQDTLGNEDYSLCIKNIRTGEIFDEGLSEISQAEWGGNNTTIYYVTENDIRRPYKVMKHTILDNSENDVEMFRDDDDMFWVWIDKSRDNKYIFAAAASKTTSYMLYLKTDNPIDTFRLISPKVKGVEYYAEHNGGYFYIMTNRDAYNFAIERCVIENDGIGDREIYIPERSNITINSMRIFEKYMVLNERMDGSEAVEIIDMTEKRSHYIDFPEKSFSLWFERNPEFSTDRFRFSYTSFISPTTVYDYDMNKRELIELKRYELECPYNSNDYVTDQLYAPARDGTMIPISLVYRKGTVISEQTPLILNGYGAYGSSMDPYFSSARLSLLDRGFVYAIAHIRGGGENGRSWYEDGKMLNKMNTFTDYIDCTEYLIESGYSSPECLIGTGGSAGGLLMGAVINMRPDLFAAVSASVPFIDLINTMLDETIPLTTAEYEEWGNPNDKEYFDYMIQYSPYDNISRQAYPNVLITAGLNDARVAFWEPLKWTAKLREYNTGNSDILLKMNTAGHGGSSGRYDFYKELAFEYAFMLYSVGIEE